MGGESADDLESLVYAARERLADDDGRLWGYSASPRWILAEDDLWWLTEPVDDAVASGQLWRVLRDFGSALVTRAWSGETERGR